MNKRELKKLAEEIRGCLRGETSNRRMFEIAALVGGDCAWVTLLIELGKEPEKAKGKEYLVLLNYHKAAREYGYKLADAIEQGNIFLAVSAAAKMALLFPGVERREYLRYKSIKPNTDIAIIGVIYGEIRQRVCVNKELLSPVCKEIAARKFITASNVPKPWKKDDETWEVKIPSPSQLMQLARRMLKLPARPEGRPRKKSK